MENEPHLYTEYRQQELGMRLVPSTVDKSVLDELLACASPARLRKFSAKHPLLLRPNHNKKYPETDHLKALQDAREILVFALDIKRLIQSDPEDWIEAAEQVLEIEIDTFDKITDFSYSIIKAQHEKLGYPEEYLYDKDYYNHSTRMQFTASLNISSLEYLDFINEHIEKTEIHPLEVGIGMNSHGEKHLDLYFENIPKNKKWLNLAIQQMFDFLCELHSHDIQQKVRNDERLYVSYSLLSSLWHILLSSIKAGRIDICPVCLSPFISGVERGSIRKYCSDPCNKKHQRLSRFRLEIERGRNLDEASETARVSKHTALQYFFRENRDVYEKAINSLNERKEK